MWLSCLFAVLPGPVNIPTGSPLRIGESAGDAKVEGDCRRAVSQRFAVQSGALDAREVAALAERQLRAIQSTWTEGQTPLNWSPRCEIVVHATRADYCAAIGCGGDISLGSTLITTDAGQIIRRRIDLLIEGKQVPALGHELTHVVAAELFDGRRPPPWVDEGMAILSDDFAKRRLHQNDLRRAYFQRATWPVEILLTRATYPPATGFATF